MKKRKDATPVAPAGPFHNPFGALSTLREALPDAPDSSAPAKAEKPAPKGPARAVVRMERAGRRGKEVTVVEQLELSSSGLEEWLKALKQSLGCGGTLEDTSLVLQGDHRERVAELLTARGVRKVILG